MSDFKRKQNEENNLYAYDEIAFLPNPELSEPMCDYKNGLTYFAFSQCGETNTERNLSCKDRCAVRIVDNFVIAAVADGADNCDLSDYGAYIAVHSAVDYLEEILKKEPQFDVKNAKGLLENTMKYACQNVNHFANRYGQVIFSFQSTLTFTIYDGNTLYFGHTGDDGIVACTQNGTLKLITERHNQNNETAFLQDVSSWRFGKYENVTAYIVATKSVLNSFVRNDRIYYQFIKPAVERKIGSPDDVQKNCFYYYNAMKSSTYRKKVTEDITFVAVTNQSRFADAKFPKDEPKSIEYADKSKTSVYQSQPSKKKTSGQNIYTPQQSSNQTQSYVPPTSSKKQDNDIIYCPFCGFRQAKSEICLNCKKRLSKESNPKTLKKSVTPAKISQKNPKKKNAQKRKSSIPSVPANKKKKSLFQKSKNTQTSSQQKDPLSVRILVGIINAFRAEPDDE